MFNRKKEEVRNDNYMPIWFLFFVTVLESIVDFMTLFLLCENCASCVLSFGSIKNGNQACFVSLFFRNR